MTATARTDADPDELVGRQEALATVGEALAANRAVCITGSAGIGKTALARVAIARSGRPCRRGAAVDYLQSRPFLPLARVLGRSLATGDAAAVALEVRREVGDSVLLLDDMQWSDPDTIDALALLAAGGPLVVTVRPGTDAARRVIKEIDVAGDVIELGPLSTRDAMLVAQRFAPRGRAATADIARASGGNPLAIAALASGRSEGRQVHADTLKAFVEDCPHGARLVLARLGLGEPGLIADRSGVSELVERRLVDVTPGGGLVLTAELFGELALDSLGDDERAELHRRLAKDADDHATAARHWAAAGDRHRAYCAALAAADVATTPSTRAELLRLAAEVAPSPVRWSTIRTAVLALLDAGQLEGVRQLLANTEDVEPPTTSDMIDRELLRGRLALDETRFEYALEIADETLERFDAEIDDEQRCWILIVRAGARGELWDLAGAITDARAAKQVAIDAGLPTLQVNLLAAALGVVAGSTTWREDLRAVFQQAIELQSWSNAREAARLLALAQFFDGDIAGGFATCRIAIEKARAINNVSWEREARGVELVNRSLVELPSASIVEEMHALLDDPATGAYRTSIATLLAIAEGDLGHFDTADGILAPFLGSSALANPPRRLEPLLWAKCEVAWLAGRLDECLEIAGHLEHASPINFGRAHAAVLARWARYERGEDPASAAGPLVTFAVQRGLLDESRAIELLAAGRHADAADAFLAAAEQHDRYLRRCALRCRWAAGEAWRRAGDRERARELLQTANSVCEQYGFVALGRRVQASRRDLGAMPTPSRSDSGALTPREREVLALVREGLSTPQIAARLRLQPSTVDSHIRKAKRRLGTSSRREAALRAADDR